MKRKIAFYGACLFLGLSLASAWALPATDAAQALIERIVPEHADQFIVEAIPAEEGKDVFEVSSRDGKVLLRGNHGGSIASALNAYLKDQCNAHLSWCGDQMNLPETLPIPPSLVRRVTPYTYRYTFNYCTFGYTMVFWDWERWERELDWMAMNGINMPLAATGIEVVYRNVYREMGLSDADIGEFISGPAYLPWFLMGNLDGWGGPLPESWYTKQEALQKKILNRARALGMKPVLPAFGGHVPKALTTTHPDAKIQRLKSWCGFAGTYVLDPSDPLFLDIGARFVREATRLYGTDHLYSADTFNEMNPPSAEPEYLKSISKAVYESMAAADPKAVWVMQGWLFLHGSFWNEDRIDALLSGVEDDNMIILDLFATAKPQWKRTKAFAGKPWIWCMLHNWGGKQGMYGRMQQVGQTLPQTLADPKAGRLVGIGSTQEGSEVNPIVFEQLYDMTWQTAPMDLEAWVQRYVHRRYGADNPDAQAAWAILLKQLYTCRDGRHGPQGSFLAMRPTLTGHGRNYSRADIFYNTDEVKRAFRLLLAAADQLGSQDTYRHDLVDLGRQVMSDYSKQVLHPQLREAESRKDAVAFKQVGERYLQAIKDTDALLQTHSVFQLGRWLQMARDKASTPAEAALYEENARRIITLWGNKTSELHGYAQRQYGGLMGDFNYTRWKMMIESAVADLEAGKEFDKRAYESKARDYDESWVMQRNDYPTEAVGDTIEMARKIAQRYAQAKAEEVGHAQSKAGDVIELFDGKTLNGWRKVGGNGRYKVEDGAIVGYGEEKGISSNTFLRTEKTYGDFELTYEFKFDNRTGNSGLMFRALQKPSDNGNGQVYGYQCEGDNTDRSWSAGLYDEARRGWLFPNSGKNEFTEQGRRLFKWDDWNTIVIRCEGNHIQTWLNGEKRVDFKDTDEKHDTREGFFGLQVHGGKSCNVRWRNLRLKQL